MNPNPAFIIDALLRICVCNEATAVWLGDFSDDDGEQVNLATWFFTDPHAAHVLVRPQDKLASRILSRLRGTLARFPNDPTIIALVDRLRENSYADRLWTEEAGIYHSPATEKRLLRRPGHTDPGQSDDADQQVEVIVYTLAIPRPDDERRLVIFALPDTEPRHSGTRSEEVCVACQRNS